MRDFDPRLKFRHLHCFLAVARFHSVQKAADSLCISQPAVSKTLRELEDIANVELFDRSSRRMQLTSFGSLFQRYASASVTSLRQGLESIDQARTHSAVTFAVGALPTVSSTLLPRAVRTFHREVPGAVVRVVSGQNHVLLTQLRLGELDLVVGRLADPEQMTGLSFEHLNLEDVVFAVRHGHPLLDTDPFDIERICDFTVLMPTEDAVIRPSVERLLIAHGVTMPMDRVETVSMAFGRAYVRDSDAVWIISRGVVVEELQAGRFHALPVNTEMTVGPIGLTTRADIAPGPTVQLLMQTLRAEATQDKPKKTSAAKS